MKKKNKPKSKNKSKSNWTLKNKIIYWFFTLWLSLGMFSTGLVQLLQVKSEVEFINKLGYPSYILIIIGVWKILGVIAVLVPKKALLKEWTYAGFFFAMSGAVASHIFAGDPLKEIFPPFLLLTLTIISYFARPADRKVSSK